MTRQQTRALWADIESAVSAAGWLLQWADCHGPLAHLPTSDPAVRIVMAARRHLLNKARILRGKVLSHA